MGQEAFPLFNIKDFLKHLSHEPGVYQMLSSQSRVLYVGKAKNLKNRLQSYMHNQHPRIQALLQKVTDIIVTVTSSEQQALALESQLIKSHQPAYNVLLKDHKAALYLSVEKNHPFPRLTAIRSHKHPQAALGPFPSRDLAEQTAEQLFKMFRLRSCSDHTFSSRTRPCLQYQIKQCSAPCVGLISEQDYQEELQKALQSMKHASTGLFESLQKQMLDFSEMLEYERAQATFEHIALLRSLQRQYHERAPDQRLDIIAMEGIFAQHMIMTDGVVRSSRFLKISNPLQESEEDLSAQLLQRCYDDLPASWIPTLVLMNNTSFLTIKIQDYDVCVRGPESASEQQWMSVAQKSLWANSKKEQNSESFWAKRFDSLQHLLGLNKLDNIDTVDISHHQGDQALGGIVRCQRQGFSKADYRYYYLNSADGQERRDDLESIEETVLRHMKRCQERSQLPDLLVVDGGKNQLSRAYIALCDAGVEDKVFLLSIAKAPGRRSGEETLYQLAGTPKQAQEIVLSQESQPAFLLLQQMRDEVHRFVIQRQRKRQREKALQHPFDSCSFISDLLKKTLLTQFGGWDGLIRAQYSQLIAIPGIGPKKASQLIEYFKVFQ